MCIFPCEAPDYSLGLILFCFEGKLHTRSTSWSCHNHSLNLAIGRWTFVFPKFGITPKGSLACCVSLVPARGWCHFIHSHIHGLATLDKDNWNSLCCWGFKPTVPQTPYTEKLGFDPQLSDFHNLGKSSGVVGPPW